MSNKNDVYNQLEDIIIQVLQKKGVLNNYHEIGTVVKQLNEGNLLVASNQFDKEPEEIPCPYMTDGYRPGDRVLIEYINGNPHHKYVMCIMQRGYEKANIDYSALKDTPMRVFRRPGSIMQDPTDMIVDLGDEKPIPMVYKVLYDENSPMEWWEILHRDSRGWLKAVTTYLPPNGKIQITNYIIRDNDDLFHYFGEDPNAGIWSSNGLT